MPDGSLVVLQPCKYLGGSYSSHVQLFLMKLVLVPLKQTV